MTKALDAPWFWTDLKSPWCASAMYQTLILVTRYFYRFLGILTEFSVREQQTTRVADVRRLRGPYAYRGGHRCCTQYRDPGRSEHPRSLG